MPRTSVKIWQRSAPRLAARATAVVSLPPRPRVVISASVDGRGALALEPGHDDDLAAVQLGADPARLDAGDPGPAVAAVGGDPGLRPGQADRRDAERVERHRDERRALVLAGREQHVELARVGLVGDGRGEAEQLVGRVAHRGDDDDEVVAGGALARDPPGDALDPVGVGDRRATELLDDERGGMARGILPCGPSGRLAPVRWPTAQPSPRPEALAHVLRPRQPPADRPDRRRRARRRAADPRPRPTATASPRSGRAPRTRAAPAIVILPDVRGLHPYYEELALRFAEHGVDALAIDCFGRTAGAEPRGDGLRVHAARRRRRPGPASPRTSRPRSRQLRIADGDRPAPTARLHARLLHGRPDVVPGGDARARPGRRRSGFYGTLVGPWRNDAPAPVDVAAQIAAPVLGLFGGADEGDHAGGDRGVRRGADGGRRRPPARDLPGRAAQLLRPQGGRVRRRQRGGVGRDAGVHRRAGRAAAVLAARRSVAASVAGRPAGPRSMTRRRRAGDERLVARGYQCRGTIADRVESALDRLLTRSPTDCTRPPMA